MTALECRCAKGRKGKKKEEAKIENDRIVFAKFWKK